MRTKTIKKADDKIGAYYNMRAAFGLTAEHISNSTGLPMEDVKRFNMSYPVDEATEITMHNFYETLTTEIDKIRKKLNLIYEIPTYQNRRLRQAV